MQIKEVKNTLYQVKCTFEDSEKYQIYLKCFMCLEYLYSPMQCKSCESLICESCLHVLNFCGRRCFGKCKGNYKKANKYFRDFISKLTVICKKCNVRMMYLDYHSTNHNQTCYPEKLAQQELLKMIKIKEDTMLKYQTDINLLKTKNKIYNRYNYGKLIKMSAEELRNILMSFNLSINQKMELYYACTEGKLEVLKNLIINKGYPILEEISYKNYYWTPLHYAMHYGQLEIIKFIMDQLKEQGIMEPVLKMQSNDGRCPLLCLLKSNHLSDSKKEEIFEKIFKIYNISLSKEIKKEAISRGYEKVLKNLGKM